MKLISVIVPVYNTEKYIEKCVMSILNQTYKNLEIILIDDGSTDNSPQICDSLAEKDNRITVIHQPNGGVSSARNIGLDNTHGDYITFVDSDDYIEPNMIEFLSENIGDTNIAMCGYTSVEENGNLSPQENVTVTDGIISTDTFWNIFTPTQEFITSPCGQSYIKVIFGIMFVFRLIRCMRTNLPYIK